MVLTAVAAGLIVLRLVDVQIVRAGDYAVLADRLLTRQVSYLAAPRGSLLDRYGRVLVSDQPAWDVGLQYAILSGDSERYLGALARALERSDDRFRGRPRAEIVSELRAGVAEMWPRLSALTGTPIAELLERGEQVRRRVERIRQEVAERSGYVQRVREEDWFHAILRDVDEDAALRLRLELEPRYPWLAVVPGAQRVAQRADALVHVLGRLGAATDDRIATDALARDELRGLRAGDRCGVSGVERAAETRLRGTRGRLVKDFDQQTVIEFTAPLRGQDVHLTIDAELQARVLDILARRVRAGDAPAGGSAVVLDAGSRDVLALVSYPVYAYDRYAQDYDTLRRDTRFTPLRCRPLAGQYPPGSTCKVIALYGGLTDGVVTERSTITCGGHFLPDQPNAFRCWIYNQYGATHGPLAAVDAIRNSCNIYFFTLGDRLGPQRLCEWFARFGLGRTQGTGLIEESPAILPDEKWLHERRGRRPLSADAWNFAVGQGEVTATPLQAANVAATVASGRWEPVNLLRDAEGRPIRADADDDARPTAFNEAALRVIRAGMWRVVNEPGGTAYAARLEHPGYVLCGKTGSAQAVPRVLNYRFTLEWPDGRRESAIAVDREELLARFDEPKPKIVGQHANERYPSAQVDPSPSHAWFIGYTQSRATPPGQPPRGRTLAIAVLIEFGGGGGHVAGPAAREIAEAVLEAPDE